MRKTISFIIPYSKGRSLKLFNTITSIKDHMFNSKFEDSFDIIIIDDFSEEFEYIIPDLKRSGLMDDGIVKFFESNAGKNIGPSVRNQGITLLSNSDYVTFVDSDDLITEDFPGMLEYHDSINKKSLITKGFVLAKFDFPHEDKLLNPPIKSGKCNKRDILRDFAFSTGCIFNREYLVEKDLIYPETRYAEDLAFMTKILMLKDTEVNIYDKVVYNSIVYKNNTMNNSWGDNLGKTLVELAKGMNNVLEYYNLNKDIAEFSENDIESIYGRNFSYVRKHI